jgi:hypothetical protein
MTIRRIVIAATVAASFSIAASAAPVAQPAPVDSKSTFTLIMTGKHTGYKHRGHWRYRHRREQNRDPFCMFSIGARLSGICDAR